MLNLGKGLIGSASIGSKVLVQGFDQFKCSIGLRVQQIHCFKYSILSSVQLVQLVQGFKTSIGSHV